MRKAATLLCGFLVGLLMPDRVMAQAIGEYGRSVQGATERHKGAPSQGTASPSKN